MPNHILSVDDMSRAFVEDLWGHATLIGSALKQNPATLLGTYPGQTLINVFGETSTRTRLSFEQAAHFLGMNVQTLTTDTAATVKGETLVRTGRTLSSLRGTSLIVMRLAEEGGVAAAASKSRVPVISGGDGGNEHPTQAILDVGAARNHLGHIDNTTWTIYGDLRNARTTRSLFRMLGKFPGVQLRLVAPRGLGITRETAKELKERQLTFAEFDDLCVAAKGAHALWGVRDQKERHSSKVARPIVFNNAVLAAMSPNAIALHPGPACDEVADEAYNDPRTDDPRVLFDEQIAYGVDVRVALIDALLGSRARQSILTPEEAITKNYAPMMI
jgi:aspartate carbamoyltransferase catalytic subunit